MRKSHYSNEEVATALRQVEHGTRVVEMSRMLGIAEATFLRLEETLRRSARPRSAKLDSCVAAPLSTGHVA
jgi:hypothetical protein